MSGPCPKQQPQILWNQTHQSLKMFSMSVYKVIETEATLKWFCLKTKEAESGLHTLLPGAGYGSPSAHGTSRPLSLGALNTSYSPPWEDAQFSLCLWLRTIISKDESSVSVLLCPRRVAQLLAVQQRSKAAHSILRDESGEALQGATSDGRDEHSPGASC